jgi:inosine-uridine nucleoside N-ribohydrolase
MRATILLLMAATLQAATLSVVVDTDAGSDDLMAIAFLLARPDVRIEAINVVHGLAHVPRGADNIRKLLVLAGRGHIPVHAGRERPLSGRAEFPAAWRKTSDELLDSMPAVAAAPPKQDAVAYYRSRSFSRTTVLALGPLTNLAAAIRTGVRFTNVIIMGGAVRVPGNLGDGGHFKTRNTTAEWNFFCDPKAAGIVLASRARIRMVALDATNQVPLDLSFLQEFQRRARSPLAMAVARLLEKDREYIRQGIFYAWDPLAAVALVDSQTVRWERLRIRVRGVGLRKRYPPARRWISLWTPME